MDAIQFVQELETFKADRLLPIVGAGQTSLTDGTPGDAKKMLQVALANEISVSEVAAAWMPTAPEIDVKLALARQAGDEAGHFHGTIHRALESVAVGRSVNSWPPASWALRAPAGLLVDADQWVVRIRRGRADVASAVDDIAGHQ